MGQLRRISEELTQLARQAKLATMATGAAIAVEHQHRIECIARSGDAAPQLGSRPSANIGLAGECLRTAEPQFCGDTETHPFVDRMHSRSFGLRSIVYVPVFRGNRPEGVVGVFADKPNHFTPHDVRVLQLIAREVTKTLKWELAPEVAPLEPPPPPSPIVEAPKPEPRANSVGQAIVIATAAAETRIGIDSSPKVLNQPTIAEPPIKVETSTKIPSEPAAAIEEVRPLFEPEPVELTPAAEESQDFDWKRQDDPNYPAKATGYLLSEEHPIRRRFTIGILTALIVGVILGVWWAVPRWTADTNLEPTADYINRPPQTGNRSIPEIPRSEPLPTTSSPALKSAAGNIPKLIFVRDVRTQIISSHVFVTIHLSGPVQFQTQQIPERIYVDLHGVELSPLLKNTRVDPAGPIAQFKFSETNEPGVVRLAMVLDAPCTFLVSVTSDPQAIVLDVQPQQGIRPSR